MLNVFKVKIWMEKGFWQQLDKRLRHFKETVHFVDKDGTRSGQRITKLTYC